jgi:hypothetical protein
MYNLINRCVKLLEDKLGWLNGQDQYLTDVDSKVDKLREEIRQVEDQLSKLQPYDPDRISVKNELQVCSFVLS